MKNRSYIILLNQDNQKEQMKSNSINSIQLDDTFMKEDSSNK